MVEYSFYTGTYKGSSIPQTDWPELEQRAQDQLSKYKRMYTVTSPAPNAEKMAICAMADAINYFNNAANGGIFVSSSIGSVSSSTGGRGVADTSAKAQEKEFYRCASQYLDIYRGVR